MVETCCREIRSRSGSVIWENTMCLPILGGASCARPQHRRVSTTRLCTQWWGALCCTSVFCGVGGGAPVRGHGCHTHDAPALGRHRPGDNDTGSCAASVVVTRGSATTTRGSCVAEECVAHGRGDSQRIGHNQRRKTHVWGGGVLPAEKWNKKRRKNQQCKPRCFGAHTA